MSKAVTAANNEYRNLPVAQLQESPTNTRRRFNEQTLMELAASFKTQGVLQPLVVRKIDDEKYEVVAGARRFRAAKLADLPTVPVRLVELSDAEAVEVQVVELSVAVKRLSFVSAALHVVDMSTTCRVGARGMCSKLTVGALQLSFQFLVLRFQLLDAKPQGRDYTLLRHEPTIS
ncbi:MAG TPA: ParB/RepB/Spo0J family partition protein [Terriglobales bacterium]|nr:ParB/RepB/Spo0J family partition protein [Terriglobales bacterium]